MNQVTNKDSGPKAERGIALLAVLLTLLLISAVATGMILMSNTETRISANFRDEQTAFFAAKAGTEEIRDRLRASATNSLNNASLPTNLPGQTNGILYITNPIGNETVAPWNTGANNYPDDEVCKEVVCGPGGVPAAPSWYVTPVPAASPAYAPAAPAPQLVWKWARVTLKTNQTAGGAARVDSVDGAANGNRICWNGTNEVSTLAPNCPAVSDQPVYVITTLAVTSTGSRRMIQTEATPTTLPPFPGAMIFDGPNPDFSTNPHSAAFAVSGQDAAQGPNAGAGCAPAVNQPALGAYDNNGVSYFAGPPSILNRPASYTSGVPYVSSPATANVSAQLGPLSTVDGLTNLVNSIAAAAGPNVYGSSTSWPFLASSGAAPTNWGTNAAPAVNVIEGDYSGGISGTGILLVTGTLTMNGNPSFNGLILVIGKGNVVKNGGGNGVLNGSLFVANLYSDPPPTYNNLIPLGANNPPGIPTIAWNGGGNATIQYDSCWINTVSQSFPLRILAQRELMR